jgi:hypothetical protein
VVLLSKKGCHLCEAVEAEIREMPSLKLKVLDIEADRTLHDKYWMTIPVLRLEGVDIFDARMMDAGGRWKKKLASLLS